MHSTVLYLASDVGVGSLLQEDLGHGDPALVGPPHEGTPAPLDRHTHRDTYLKYEYAYLL